MMGSGKSTIGRAVAARTGWPYIDNDELVQRARGMTARELLATAGEAELRRTEADALLLGLAQPEPVLIGAAGGTILEPAIRETLVTGALVVWLRTSPKTLAARARGAAHRPWLATDAEGWMRRTLAERTPLYESVANLSVRTEGRSVGKSAAEIVDWLAASSTCAERPKQAPD